MAKRVIDAALFGSGDLIDCAAWERLLYTGMIVSCDDQGYIRLASRWLRARILPSLRISEAAIERTLDKFATRNMIVRYNLDGVSYGRIKNFQKYQRLKRPRKSEIHERLSSRRGKMELKEGGRRCNVSGGNSAPRNAHASTGKPAEPEPRPEPAARFDGDAYEALTRHPWGFGDTKARAICERGVTVADVTAWDAWARQRGRPAAVKAIQQFRHPRQIPADPADAAGDPRGTAQRILDTFEGEPTNGT